MGRLIAKIDGRYCEWSTVVDAPVTRLLTKPEFEEHYRNEYGRKGLEEELPARMERVEKQGTSCLHGTTVDDLIEDNRAGKHEKRLTLPEIIEHYGTETKRT